MTVHFHGSKSTGRQRIKHSMTDCLASFAASRRHTRELHAASTMPYVTRFIQLSQWRIRGFEREERTRGRRLVSSRSSGWDAPPRERGFGDDM